MTSPTTAAARAIRNTLDAEPDVYSSGVAEKLMALPEAYANCVRFVSSVEFLDLITAAEKAGWLRRMDEPETIDTIIEGWTERRQTPGLTADHIADLSLFIDTLKIYRDEFAASPTPIPASEGIAEPVEPGTWWTPIASAPRDGTHILLAFGQDGVMEGWWENNDNDPRPWKFVDKGCADSQFTAGEMLNGSRDGDFGPSHWMLIPWGPIPAPTVAAALTPPAPAVPDIDQRIAVWMKERGYTTGHGDTIEDMLSELVVQARKGFEPSPVVPDELVRLSERATPGEWCCTLCFGENHTPSNYEFADAAVNYVRTLLNKDPTS